jgi:predicted SAM-dependent methyltransferase
MLKLNLGSGPEQLKLKGYENIDLIDGKSAYPLKYDTESTDEIRASHILEHFGKHEVQSVLRNWVDKLRPGGVLKIAVPDFDKIAVDYVNQIKHEHSPDEYIMGSQSDENDFHKSIFNKTILTKLLESAGLVDIQVWKSEIEDCASMDVSLNLRGQKPGGLETKIQAVMSMPRLGFTANMFAASTTFPALGIGWKVGNGVFWGQVLSRMIEKHELDNTEYLITVDYDTWFKKEHVIRLLQLMAENPDVDAIVAVQIKRENEVPMFSMVDEDGNGRGDVPLKEFKEELVPICNGHFGLTIFRASVFAELKRPWFQAHPDSDGRWNEGHIDEDIHFWHNFRESGKKVCLAPKINLGHLQIKCTFAGPVEDGFEPVEYYMDVMNRGEYAEHCVPKVEMLK